jgi:hypothetical protein
MPAAADARRRLSARQPARPAPAELLRGPQTAARAGAASAGATGNELMLRPQKSEADARRG